MIEEVLFVFLGLLLAFNFGMFLTIRRCESVLLALSFDAAQLKPDTIVDAVQNEIGDVVAEVVNHVTNMRTPTVADHLGGVIAQFAQMRMMKMLQAEGALPDAVAQSIDDLTEH